MADEEAVDESKLALRDLIRNFISSWVSFYNQASPLRKSIKYMIFYNIKRRSRDNSICENIDHMPKGLSKAQ